MIFIFLFIFLIQATIPQILIVPRGHGNCDLNIEQGYFLPQLLYILASHFDCCNNVEHARNIFLLQMPFRMLR